jgi:hypothetical protein
VQIITAWQRISPEVIVKGFQKFCISIQVDGTMVVCCGLALKRLGMLGISVRKMKTLTVKREMVTLIGRGR